MSGKPHGLVSQSCCEPDFENSPTCAHPEPVEGRGAGEYQMDADEPRAAELP